MCEQLREQFHELQQPEVEKQVARTRANGDARPQKKDSDSRW